MISSSKKICATGCPQPKFEFGTFFTVIFRRPSFTSKEKNGGLNGGLIGGLNGGLNDALIILFDSIAEHPGVQIKELVVLLNRLRDTLDKHIKTLVEKGLVERRGSRKTGGYYIKDNTNS